MLDLSVASGAGCFELDGRVDLAVAKKRVSATALKGNLDTTHLVQGGSDEIARDARHAIEQGASGGGFTLSSGCALGRDTKPENVDADAMVRAAEQFGQDPL